MSHEVLPESIIIGLKARSINSNWDISYIAVCITLIELLAALPDRSSLWPLRPWDTDWITALRNLLARTPLPSLDFSQIYRRLAATTFEGITGLDLIEQFDHYASMIFGQQVEGVFTRQSPLWAVCQDLFQQWYLGDELYTQEYGKSPEQTGKHGCIYLERPLLPAEQLQATLAQLREQGYVLGVATGRPAQEAIVPLKNYGLFEYFDPERVVTYTQAVLAEQKLRAAGDMTALVKPHPYQFIAAFDPHYQPHQPAPEPGSFIVVGDTTSDVRGGHAAGALVIAVLTGARTEEARTLLQQSDPDFVIDDATHVPALLTQIDDLLTIQRLQFAEREKAEALLKRWFVRHMDLRVEHVTLMPKAVSLNSFNGIYQVDGEEYFFKTHVEEQGIVSEYYHAEFLFNAGYNIVKPLQTIHQSGQQMVIYPVIHDPVMFDLMRAVETGDTSQTNEEILVAAERRECDRLLDIYRKTLTFSSAEEHAQAPVHQLFWHRLTGGRLQSFYEGKVVPLPEGSASPGIAFDDLLQYQWIINGEEVTGDMSTLGQLIERAMLVLEPSQAMYTAIGHGDAHFGNVFLEQQEWYRYFDPAFAGRHTPLLDIVKPFFHNVYAMWMYFSHEIAQNLELSVVLRDKYVIIDHNYTLPSVRRAILETKQEHLLRPLLALLREQQALPENWSEIMRMALMCCPLLTINLLDATKRPASICWLGLSQVIQMGNLSLIGA
ncbi:MAG TPA: HAD hydrolase-like protein [Dictyobacter sp.]|nr:HAD hydrolase-like protein [Dictyobacter sp.]